MHFEQLVAQFEPMIYHLLHKYHIRDREKDFYQEGVIALWRAKQSYDPTKGEFSTYAYFLIQKAFFTIIRKENKRKEKQQQYMHYVQAESLSYNNELPFDPYLLEAIKQTLSKDQMTWFEGKFFHQQTNKQIARAAGVTESAVKNWGRFAKPKIKRVMKRQQYDQ